MRTYRLILSLLLTAPLCINLAAQELHDKAWSVLNEGGALWMGSENAAGLSFDAPAEFNLLDADFSYERGYYRLKQSPKREGELTFDTQGLKKIGRITAWGRFSYSNSSESGASFNTLLGNPYDERFMYTAADSVEGQWKKQSYLLQFKAALPLGDRVSTGLHVIYNDRIAAGQIDPRAESYHYSVSVKPALAWTSDFGTMGLNGLYTNTFERSTPSISNSQEIQKVFLLRGLGNWVGDQVGGSGLSTMYFRCNSWGGGLQYSWSEGWKLLADLGYTVDKTAITESATQPKPHGNTYRQSISGSVSAIWGETVQHFLRLSAKGVKTKGTEHTVLWDTGSGQWITAMSIDQVMLRSLDASLDWNAYLTDGEAYSWHWGAGAAWEGKDDTYALPHSVFRYGNASISAIGERRFRFSNSSLTVAVRLRVTKNLYGEYSYQGHRSATAPVRDLYTHNLSILSADRLQAGLEAEYAFGVAKGINLAFFAQGSYLTASCDWVYEVSGTARRQRGNAIGGVKLYF